jgi:MFS transporter, PAT family, beta-lactamase induction signal transducer AmpG
MITSTPKKLGLLSALYLAQGLPYGFFLQALPAVMREQKYSLELIGLTSLLALPWGGKFLWSPLIDRYGSARFGRRRSFILPIQLLTIAVLLGLASVAPQGSMTIILASVFVVNLLAATQDVATDALAVDLMEEKERGIANGVQVAAYRVGMIVGGGWLLSIYSRLEWRGTFLAMAGIVFLTTIPIAFFREPSSTSEIALPNFLRRPGAPRVLLICATYKIGAYLMQGMLRPFLLDGGFTLDDIGAMLGGIGFTAGLAGAMVGGVLLRRIPRRAALIAFGVIQAFTVLGFAVLPAGPLDRGLVTALAAAEHFTGGMATTALFTSMMDQSAKSSAAFDYTLQASIVVIANGIASSASGFSASALGYPQHFAFAALVTALGAALAGVLLPSTPRLRPGAEDLNPAS